MAYAEPRTYLKPKQKDEIMNYQEVYQTESKHLKSDEIKGREYTLEIDRWAIEELGNDDKKDRKVVIYFKGAEKGLALNKTNAVCIGDAYGDDMNYWVGKPIVLYVARVQFGDKMVDGLRVRIPQPAATALPGQPGPVQQGIAAQAPLPQDGPTPAAPFPGDTPTGPGF